MDTTPLREESYERLGTHEREQEPRAAATPALEFFAEPDLPAGVQAWAIRRPDRIDVLFNPSAPGPVLAEALTRLFASAVEEV